MPDEPPQPTTIVQKVTVTTMSAKRFMAQPL